MVGSLFLRSLERSERVFSAMAARGYDGQVRSLARFQMISLDWVFFFAVLPYMSLTLALAMVV
jgi:cobalt/nickel transport system permease protein